MKKIIARFLFGFMFFAMFFTGTGLAENKVQAAAGELAPREVLNFNTDWLYTPNNLTNGQEVGLDDSGFEQVNVPHANKILEKHKGNDFQKQIESFRFISWYRRHFLLDSSYAGKRIAVEFQAVATVAEVYVNGEYAGEHKGAYTTFTIDITDFVKTDGSDNVIAVKVDSTKRSDLPPEGGNVDFLLFGGIVRDVNMIITDPVNVEWTYMTTPDLTAAGGKLNAQTKVVNSGSQAVTCKVETTLKDRDGSVVTTMTTSEAAIAAGQSNIFEHRSETINNPHLWDVDDPYLYQAESRILVNNVCVDKYITSVGFRFFEFKDEPGDGNFYLNGKKTKISGINRHEQLPYIGRAVNNKMQVADADLIRDTGFNAVRTSHYPQDPEFLARCDEIGLLVFTEPPGWQHIGDTNWQNEFTKNLEELIIRDRNHPSIISWGVRPNESVNNTAGDNTYRSFIQRNIALSKELDPTRPTHGVRIEYHYEQGSYCDEDLYTVNYRYPENPKFKPYLVTEYPMSWGLQGIEGTENYRHQQWIHDWADKADYYFRNDLVAGAFGWSMFDYNNEVNYTNTGHVFPSGLYDLFRNDKPVSWLFRSQKDPEEETVLYIANYWATDAPSEVIVLSNCDEVELFRGNTSLGKITPNRYLNLPQPVFVFSNVSFSAGNDLKAVGYIDGQVVKETVRKTPGAAVKLSAVPEYDTLIADGTDMTMVAVTLTDANGTRLPYASNEVSIEVSGAGRFIGESAVNLEGGRIGFLVQTKYLEAGEITCTVTASGITAGECRITVNPYTPENIVPVSEGSGNIKPMILTDINDNKVGTGFNTFRYSGNWIYEVKANDFMNDNTYSNTTGDYCEIIFSGEYIELYGSKERHHGILGVSIDGGAETLVDCYSASSERNVKLYASEDLSSGIHTMRVRVTGTRNSSSTGDYIGIDRVRVMSTETAIYNANQSEYVQAGTLRTDTRNDFTGAYSAGNRADWGVDGGAPWSNIALWIGQNTYIYNHPFERGYAKDKVLYFNFDYWVYRNLGNTDGEQRISALPAGATTLDSYLPLVTTPENGFYGDNTFVHGGTDVCDMLVIMDNINHTLSYYRNGILIEYKEVDPNTVLTGIAIHGGRTEYIAGVHNMRYGQLKMTDLTVAVNGNSVAGMTVTYPVETTDLGLLAIYDSQESLVQVWKNPEPSMTFTLAADDYTAKAFLWDSGMKPLLKTNELSFTTTGDGTVPQGGGNSFDVELDSETLGEGEVSLICYDPDWDGSALDMENLAYLNQYTIGSGKMTVRVHLGGSTKSGTYTVTAVGSQGQMNTTYDVGAKSALKSAIEKAQSLKEEEYTAASWNAFCDVRDAAEVIYNKSDATQAEINRAISNLNDAMEALKPISEKQAGTLTISCAGFTYDGTTLPNPQVVSTTNTGAVVTYKYYRDPACTTEIAAPKNAGTYYVVGTAAGTDTYLAATSAAVSFTIAPKNVTTATVTGVEAQYYTGKEVVLPQLAVTGYTAGTDYNVSYQNNTKVGTATVTITFTGNYTGTISRTFAVLAGNDADLPLKNKIYAVGKYKYKVTKSAATGGTVELKAPVKKNMKQAKAVNFVKINGYRFKVTSIAPNAFKDNKKLKQFTIGTNIVKIGKNAFYKAKNLKKVTIKTTKLKTKKVGKKAFARIYSKAVIRVPKKKVKTYQKFLKKAGLPGQAKVK